MFEVRIVNRGLYTPISPRFETEEEAEEYMNKCSNYFSRYVDDCEHTRYPNLKPKIEGYHL